MSLDPNFCKRADVYNCARNDHGIIIAALTANPAVALVVFFIFRLAVYGSFYYAKQNTVSGMVSAAFGTLVGKKAASYDDAWRSLGTYGKKGEVPYYAYLGYIVPFALWIATYYFAPSGIAYMALLTVVIMLSFRNTVDQTTIYVHGGFSSGLVFVIFQLLTDKLQSVSGNDEEFLMMLVSMTVFVWALVTFLASLNAPATRALGQQWGVAQARADKKEADAKAQTEKKEQFDKTYTGSADRFAFVYNQATTGKQEGALRQLQHEFALKYAKADAKRLEQNKPPIDLTEELKKFAHTKGLPAAGAPVLPLADAAPAIAN